MYAILFVFFIALFPYTIESKPIKLNYKGITEQQDKTEQLSQDFCTYEDCLESNNKENKNLSLISQITQYFYNHSDTIIALSIVITIAYWYTTSKSTATIPQPLQKKKQPSTNNNPYSLQQQAQLRAFKRQLRRLGIG